MSIKTPKDNSRNGENMSIKTPTLPFGKMNNVIPMNTGGKFLGFAQATNLIGAIAESYNRTLDYRTDIKRLEMEELRIEEQARLTNNAIDKNFKQQMAHLANRRVEVMAYYETLYRELSSIHDQRQAVMKMVEEIQKVALHPETPLEEKRLHHEAALQYLSYSTEWGQHAGRQLEQAKQTLPLVDLQKIAI